MTAHPTRENAGHWWLCTWDNDELHAVRAYAWNLEEWANSSNGDYGLTAPTLCGTAINAIYPSLGARLENQRCPGCCHTLGIPEGNGTPANRKNPA